MKQNKDLVEALEQISLGHNVDKKTLIEALEAALSSASRKTSGSPQTIKVNFDESTGKIEIFSRRKVVEMVSNPSSEITKEEALKIKKDINVGDDLDIKMEWDEFGRIAAQTTRQVVLQKMREVERNQIYDKFKEKIGEVVPATVSRFEGEDIIVEIWDVEALLPHREQIFKEILRKGDIIKVYILEARKVISGHHVIVSRTHPGLLKKLLEIEIPEISDGTIEVKAIGREPGHRAKVAVISKDSKVDPVGTCIGIRNGRLQAVVRELQGEKIDVIEWDKDMKKLISKMLSPARINEIIIRENIKQASIIVPDDQLSLAIGKKGQNARLASRLTGWRIDIKSELKLKEEQKMAIEMLTRIDGVGEKLAIKLFEAGFITPMMIASSNADELKKVEGIGEATAERLVKTAKKIAEEGVKESNEKKSI